jgi:hypothetical protein
MAASLVERTKYGELVVIRFLWQEGVKTEVHGAMSVERV